MTETDASAETTPHSAVGVYSVDEVKLKDGHSRPQVFMDVTVAGQDIGRIIFELFDDIAPKTCENFFSLCTGEVKAKEEGVELNYLGTRFHRVVKGFMIQGGELGRSKHSGGALKGSSQMSSSSIHSIFGGPFKDESFELRCDRAGLLCMANRGRDTNGSQFFITCSDQSHLTGQYVVFGRVVGGMPVVRSIENCSVNSRERPRFPVCVRQCGDYKAFLRIRQELLDKEMLSEQLETTDSEDTRQLLRETGEDNSESVASLMFEQSQNDQGSNDQTTSDMGSESSHLKNPLLARLASLKAKRKEASAMNRAAVMGELKKLNDQSSVSSFNNDDDSGDQSQSQSQKKKFRKKRKASEMDSETLKDKVLNESALFAAEKSLKKRKKAAPFGWDVFNQDTLYTAYDKRCERMVKSGRSARLSEKEANETDLFAGQLDYGQTVKDDPSRIEAMIGELRETAERRSKFQRRRTYYEDSDVSHINRRNEVFNKKVERAFGEYAAGIRANFERGTAL